MKENRQMRVVYQKPHQLQLNATLNGWASSRYKTQGDLSPKQNQTSYLFSSNNIQSQQNQNQQKHSAVPLNSRNGLMKTQTNFSQLSKGLVPSSQEVSTGNPGSNSIRGSHLGAVNELFHVYNLQGIHKNEKSSVKPSTLRASLQATGEAMTKLIQSGHKTFSKKNLSKSPNRRVLQKNYLPGAHKKFMVKPKNVISPEVISMRGWSSISPNSPNNQQHHLQVKIPKLAMNTAVY